MADWGEPVLVIGLGRFGAAVAETLTGLGREVLAVDNDAGIVQRYSGRLTHVVEADSTSVEAMRQIGAGEFRRAVVGMGTAMEASILTVAVLVDLGVETIWAKAITMEHGRILERIGAKNVVLPERAMGERVAHAVADRALNFIEFEDGFAMVETAAPERYFGQTLGETRIRSDHGVTVVCVKRPGEDFTHATPATLVEPGDLLIVAGRTEKAERFARRV